MSNSFIRTTAVSAMGKVLRVESIDVPIKLCMLGSKLENEALIWSGKLIYWILWFRFIHFLIHNSASVSFCPSVVPYLPEIVPKDLSGGGIAAELIMFLLMSVFPRSHCKVTWMS